MICSSRCQGKLYVYSTVPRAGGLVVQRYRACPDCGRRLLTMEIELEPRVRAAIQWALGALSPDLANLLRKRTEVAIHP